VAEDRAQLAVVDEDLHVLLPLLCAASGGAARERGARLSGGLFTHVVPFLELLVRTCVVLVPRPSEGRVLCRKRRGLTITDAMLQSATAASETTKTRAALVAGLRALMPDERVIADAGELFVYESDGFTIAKSRPAAVVFPTTA